VVVFLLTALFALFVNGASAHDAPAPSGTAAAVAIDPGLGPLHHPVSTRSRQAQAYFDQGLKLVFAFNHEAAIKSFARAAELDPGLAMAHWGIAYALGPNYNLPMSPAAHAKAYAALQEAIARKPRASPAERAYIDALATRYSARPDADRAPLALAYKDAMAGLVRRYPNDVDAAVLYAESLMNLNPWKLWAPDGTPREGTREIVAVLERALARAPNHIGAIHYYIHAVEASPHPEKALAHAKRLPALAPSAGHLVHMPAHTYIRTGAYAEAVAVNEIAARADERLIASGERTLYLVGYYGHNLHFIAISAALAGNSAKSLAAADKLAAYVAPKLSEAPFVDGFLCTPELVRARFGRWDDILALPEPPFEAPVTGALWRFARALALSGKGRADAARDEQARFVQAVATVPKSLDLGNNTANAVLAVAVPYLDGRLALAEGNITGAITRLREAVGAEDALAYDEPPAWYLSSREALGEALLKTRDFPAAEQVFRDDLARNIESGRALDGLRAALAAQGRKRDAALIGKRQEHAWRNADVPVSAASL